MGVPSPTIPSFTDGTVVHQGDLNALATNLTNLYNYNQGGFFTQRPCVIAVQTTGQGIASGSDTLVSFNSATVNTDNMWTVSQPTQLNIQVGGIYWLFSQVRWPALSTATLSTTCASNLMVNGTVPGVNTVAANLLPFVIAGAGPGNQCGILANLSAGATVYLDVWHSAGSSQTLQTNFGGTFLGAIFLTPSS